MLRRTTSPPSVAPSSTTPASDAEPDSPARRFTDAAGTCATRFGPNLRIHGSITGADSVQIAGQMEGPIDVDGFLHVAEGARVTGAVNAADAVVEGELHGRLAARGRVELSATAKVRADIHAPTVAIAEGCFFDGRIHMGASEGEGGPMRFREKRRRRGGRSAGGPETAAPAPQAAAAAPEDAARPAAAQPGASEPAAPEAAPAQPAAATPTPAEPAPAAPSGAPAGPPVPRPVL